MVLHIGGKFATQKTQCLLPTTISFVVNNSNGDSEIRDILQDNFIYHISDASVANEKGTLFSLIYDVHPHLSLLQKIIL